MVHGGKKYFIRFNPEISTRLIKLESTIEKVLKEIHEDQNTELLKVIHLYYSVLPLENTRVYSPETPSDEICYSGSGEPC
jgi:hypothetical protein